MSMSREEVVSHFEQERERWHNQYVAAKTLARTHPAVGYRLREQADLKLIVIDEIMRRMARGEMEISSELEQHIIREQEERRRISDLADADLLRGYLQETWRDRGLMKAAKRDGLSLRELASILLINEDEAVG